MAAKLNEKEMQVAYLSQQLSESRGNTEFFKQKLDSA